MRGCSSEKNVLEGVNSIVCKRVAKEAILHFFEMVQKSTKERPLEA